MSIKIGKYYITKNQPRELLKTIAILQQENQELKTKLKELKDKEKNKDTRNSRQRVDNKKLHMKNQELRDLNRAYVEIISDNKENYKLLSSEIKELKNQQKEFIEFLENEINSLKKCMKKIECSDRCHGDYPVAYYIFQYKSDEAKEISSKYKEIMEAKE